MQGERHVETDDYAIEHDREIDAVVFRWEAFVHGERFREGAEALAEVAETVETERLLVDVRAFAEHSHADKAWLRDVAIPRTSEAGARRVAIVHSGSELQRLDVGEFAADAEDVSGETLVSDDLEAARSWLEEG